MAGDHEDPRADQGDARVTRLRGPSARVRLCSPGRLRFGSKRGDRLRANRIILEYGSHPVGSKRRRDDRDCEREREDDREGRGEQGLRRVEAA